MMTTVTIPPKNVLIKSLLFSLVIGKRVVLDWTSSSEGAGTFSSSQTNTTRGIAKARPVKKGTHSSDKLNCNSSDFATVLTNPEEKIKLTASAAPMKSVAFRPSTYEKTIPQIIPSGKPLTNMKAIL